MTRRRRTTTRRTLGCSWCRAGSERSLSLPVHRRALLPGSPVGLHPPPPPPPPPPHCRRRRRRRLMRPPPGFSATPRFAQAPRHRHPSARRRRRGSGFPRCRPLTGRSGNRLPGCSRYRRRRCRRRRHPSTWQALTAAFPTLRRRPRPVSMRTPRSSRSVPGDFRRLPSLPPLRYGPREEQGEQGEQV